MTALLLGLALLPATAAAGPSAGLVVGTDGNVAVSLSVVLSDGSALRYAMDGNFTPFIDALPFNDSQKASTLSSINAAESSLLLAGLFGNRDGTVEPSEVSLFEALLRDEVGLVPAGTLTGGSVVSLTMNGKAPSSSEFVGVTFSGAPGAVASTAPMTVTSSTTESFAPEGTSGTLVASWNFTIVGPIALPAPNATLAVTTPAGTSIGTATGLESESTQNDLWGYGTSSATGSVGPSPSGSATFSFHPAFPLGDVVIGVVLAGAVAALALLLWRRRRRTREADDAPRD